MFKCWLSLTVRVNVVLYGTVVVNNDWHFDNLCGSHLQSQKYRLLDRLLDQSSYNPTSRKATTIRTLTRRAQLFCHSPESLQDETDYLNNVFSKNNYNTDFVKRNTHSNTDSNTQTNVNSGPVTTTPYIRGTSESIARILQSYNIRVAHKPISSDDYLLISRTKTNRRNTNERREMVTLTIALLNTIYRRNIKSAGTLRHVLNILQTTINDSL